MQNIKSKLAPPILSRATTWTAERVAALPQVLDVRQLLANAERLGETELAAICAAEITKRRSEALRASKAKAVARPKAVVRPAVSKA